MQTCIIVGKRYVHHLFQYCNHCNTIHAHLGLLHFDMHAGLPNVLQASKEHVIIHCRGPLVNKQAIICLQTSSSCSVYTTPADIKAPH